MSKQSYRVEGMMCNGCVGSVKRAVEAIAGGATVEVSLEDKRLSVDGFDDEEALRQAVEEAGFDFGGKL